MKETFLAFFMAAIGLAVVAVIVSQRSNTGSVLTTAAGAVGNIITAAEGPIR